MQRLICLYVTSAFMKFKIRCFSHRNLDGEHCFLHDFIWIISLQK